MSLSRDIFTYGDVKQVLESALSASGAIYRLPTPSAATRWRLRAYHYRKLLRAHLSEIAGHPTETPFDMMRLTIPADDKSAVHIAFEPAVVGSLTSLDGKPIDEKDEYESEALAFLETLK